MMMIIALCCLSIVIHSVTTASTSVTGGTSVVSSGDSTQYQNMGWLFMPPAEKNSRRLAANPKNDVHGHLLPMCNVRIGFDCGSKEEDTFCTAPSKTCYHLKGRGNDNPPPCDVTEEEHGVPELGCKSHCIGITQQTDTSFDCYVFIGRSCKCVKTMPYDPRNVLLRKIEAKRQQERQQKRQLWVNGRFWDFKQCEEHENTIWKSVSNIAIKTKDDPLRPMEQCIHGLVDHAEHNTIEVKRSDDACYNVEANANGGFSIVCNLVRQDPREFLLKNIEAIRTEYKPLWANGRGWDFKQCEGLSQKNTMLKSGSNVPMTDHPFQHMMQCIRGLVEQAESKDIDVKSTDDACYNVEANANGDVSIVCMLVQSS